MNVQDHHAQIENLSAPGCERHLRTEQIGRVALMVDDDHPEIFPVNYIVDEVGDIFFRTDPGTKLDAVANAPTIAFEIDGIDDEREQGWSVLVVGEARHLGNPAEVDGILEHLESWPAGGKADVVRLRPTKVTGRRVHRPSLRMLPGR